MNMRRRIRLFSMLFAVAAIFSLPLLRLSAQQQQPGQPAPPPLFPQSPASVKQLGQPAPQVPAPQTLPSPTPPPQDSQAEDGPQPGDVKFGISTINILAPVTVLDKKGKPVNGLTPLDFELYDNGRRQKITEDIAAHPISLVMVIQANAAMEQILPNVRKLGSLVNGLVLGEFGEVAVIGFDHRFQVDPFTSDPDMLADALKKLKPGSNSSRLNDAVMEGVNMLARRPRERKRIILIVS